MSDLEIVDLPSQDIEFLGEAMINVILPNGKKRILDPTRVYKYTLDKDGKIINVRLMPKRKK